MAHDVWCAGLGMGHLRVIRVEVLDVVTTNVHLHNRICIRGCYLSDYSGSAGAGKLHGLWEASAAPVCLYSKYNQIVSTTTLTAPSAMCIARQKQRQAPDCLSLVLTSLLAARSLSMRPFGSVRRLEALTLQRDRGWPLCGLGVIELGHKAAH